MLVYCPPSEARLSVTLSFNDPDFAYFLTALVLAYWGLGRLRLQNGLLLAASYVFYGWVHPWVVGLLVWSTLVDYGCALGMERNPKLRGILLWTSVFANLGVLAIFKYYDFFSENVALALSLVGLELHPETLGLLVPIGISFYTFQTLGYTIEVYHRRIKACTNLIDFGVYVSFFPQLLAGPIERAQRLLPQVQAASKFNLMQFRSGLTLISWGLFQKALIGDQIAPFVDRIFAMQEPPGPALWAAALGFGVQMMADFGGYTDIARGSARLMGFELMRNFDGPFLARSPITFWQRWHISLSTWLRDYVFLPLAIRRPTRLGMSLAGLITFLLAGLWHGAAWNFVLLGLIHFLAVFACRALGPALLKGAPALHRSRLFSISLFLPFILLSSLIFRSGSMDDLLFNLSRNPIAATQEQWVVAKVVLLTSICGCAPMALAYWLRTRVAPKLEQSPWLLPCQTALWSIVLVLVAIFARDTSYDFLYFRF